MAKAGRGADQYMVRFPPGLRDRVKAYAELQGRSMNDEIVRILEHHFPEPESVEQRMTRVLSLVAMLKGGARNVSVDRLFDELYDGVRSIADGTLSGVDESTRDRIHERLERWEEIFAEDENERSTDGLDPNEVDALSRGRSTAKYPLDREWRRYVRQLEGRGLSEAEEDAFKRGLMQGMDLAVELEKRSRTIEDLDIDEVLRVAGKTADK